MKIKRTTLLAIVVMTMSLPAAGQVHLGLRGGVALGELHFDREIIDSNNRIGYNGGLVLDIAIPVTGIGIDASVLYTHRYNRLTDGDRLFKRHYIEIPVMARYRLAIAGVERFLAPIVFTGPSFSVLFDDNGLDNWKGRKTCLSWQAGGGVDLFHHLRVTASYSFGLTKAMSYIDTENTSNKAHGKDRYWMLNAAWLF